MAVDTVVADTSSTVAVTVGTPLNGEIDSAYEQDWYRVALTANVNYTIRLVGLGTGANTLGDPLIDGIYSTGNVYVRLLKVSSWYKVSVKHKVIILAMISLVNINN